MKQQLIIDSPPFGGGKARFIVNKVNQDKCKYCQVLAITEFDLPEGMADDSEALCQREDCLHLVKMAGEWLDMHEIEYIWQMNSCPDHGDYRRNH